MMTGLSKVVNEIFGSRSKEEVSLTLLAREIPACLAGSAVSPLL